MNQDKNSPFAVGLTHRLSSRKWPVEALFRMAQKTRNPRATPIDQFKVLTLKFLNDYLRHGRCKLSPTKVRRYART